MPVLSRPRRRRLAVITASELLLTSGGAFAQTKITIGCTATSDCASAMVAVDEGIFARHGLDAKMILIGINSNIPAAIISDSIQIGGPTATVFLQAVDGGHDLIAIEGATIKDPMSTVLTAEPFVTRFNAAGLGYVGAHYAADLARTEPIISYVASRAFAEKNPEAIAAFRAAIVEAAAIVNNDRQKASESISKFTKQPLDLVKTNRPNLAAPDVKPDGLVWWLEVMKQQNMLQTQIDPAKIVLK